jgi:hypothetical protein
VDDEQKKMMVKSSSFNDVAENLGLPTCIHSGVCLGHSAFSTGCFFAGPAQGTQLFNKGFGFFFAVTGIVFRIPQRLIWYTLGNFFVDYAAGYRAGGRLSLDNNFTNGVATLAAP